MPKYLWLSLMLFVGTVLAGPLPDKPHIYIEGSAEVEVAPDQMTISVGLESTNQKLAVAKEDVDERSRRLIAAVKKLGIAPEDLTTTALHVSPAYEYRGGEQVPLGTRVYRQVEITLRDLAKYGDLMAALVDAQISNTVSTRLEVSDQEALADKAFAKAIADARERARAIAESMGQRLGRAHSISQFNTRGNERYELFSARGMARDGAAQAMPKLADSGSEPFEPGLIKITAQVYAVFMIK